MMMFADIPPANGVIIHPGAVGDCLLTLPLAAYMKDSLNLRRLDFIGRMEAIEFYPGRTCIDRVRSLDSMPLHRLFAEASSFVLEDKDRLAAALEDYEQIISFLGHGHPHFENNLLFCVHSTHSGEVTMLPLCGSADDKRHVSDLYVELFSQQQRLECPPMPAQTVFPSASDFAAGRGLLEQADVEPDKPIILIQPGSGSREKCWHLQNFMHAANLLKEQGLEPVFLLGPVEQERLASENLNRLSAAWPVLSNLTLTRVLQVLTQADLYLGNDSGIGHLAAGLGRKTVGLFGPASHVSQYRPKGEHVTVLQPDAISFHEADPSAVEAVVREIGTRL
jgi:ADP-heptose:LPS heptosyltransferase